MNKTAPSIESLANQEYKWGFVTEIEAELIPKGLTDFGALKVRDASVNGEEHEIPIFDHSRDRGLHL